MQAHNDYRERLRSGVLQPVCAALDSGRQVAMVTLGDVSVYSTASYVRQLLAEKGYATQVIAGVPSFCAGAAKAQQSLCENSESLQILPAVHSREAVETALEQFDNLVVMKPDVLWRGSCRCCGNGDCWNILPCSAMWHAVGIHRQAGTGAVFIFYHTAHQGRRSVNGIFCRCRCR